MMWADDPERDFLRHDRETQKWLDSRPGCVSCGDPIQDECYYDFGDGPMCEDCKDSYVSDCRHYIEW